MPVHRVSAIPREQAKRVSPRLGSFFFLSRFSVRPLVTERARADTFVKLFTKEHGTRTTRVVDEEAGNRDD